MAANKLIRAVVADMGGANVVQGCLNLAVEAGHQVEVLHVGMAIRPLINDMITWDSRICVKTVKSGESIGRFWTESPCDLIVAVLAKSDARAEVDPLVTGILNGRASVVLIQGEFGLLIPVLDRVRDSDSLSLVRRLCVATDRFHELALERYPDLEMVTVVTGPLRNQTTEQAQALWTEMEAVLAFAPVLA